MFLEKTSGYDVFPADQFGEKIGMNNDGEVVTASQSTLSIYFEWQLNSDGEYDIFCSIVTEDELNELLDNEEDEPEEEEMNEEKKTPFEGPYSKTVAPKSEKKKHNEVAKLARRAIKKVKKKLDESKDVLDKGLKRTDLGLSDKLNKKGKLSKHTQTWMKRLSSGSGSLYSRDLGKPKGHLPEDYDHDAAADARETGNIKTGARKGSKERKKWERWHKHDINRAVTGMEGRKEGKKIEEQQLNEISRKLAKRYVKKATSSAEKKAKNHNTGRALQRLSYVDLATDKLKKAKWTRKSKVPATKKLKEENLNEVSKALAKRATDKAFKKFYNKYDDATAARGKYIKSKNNPEHKPEFERTEKELRKAGRQMVRFSKYAEKKLKEENINEISAGKANDAYHAAKDKLLDADIMSSVTKGAAKKKWDARSKKRHSQAVKFANYSDKKKWLSRKTEE